MSKLDLDDFDDSQHDDEEPDEAARRIIRGHLNKLDERLKLTRKSAKSQNRHLGAQDREEVRAWLRHQVDLTLEFFQDDKGDGGGFSFSTDGDW